MSSLPQAGSPSDTEPLPRPEGGSRHFEQGSKAGPLLMQAYYRPSMTSKDAVLLDIIWSVPVMFAAVCLTPGCSRLESALRLLCLCQKWQCCGSVNSLMAVRSHCKLLHFAYCYEAYVEYLSERQGHYMHHSESPVICTIRCLHIVQYAAYAADTHHLHIHYAVKLPCVHR